MTKIAGSGSIGQRYGWICGSGSVPKCHGSATLAQTDGILTVLRVWDVYHGSRIRLLSIPDPGSEFFPSRISIKNLSILAQKMVSKL